MMQRGPKKVRVFVFSKVKKGNEPKIANKLMKK